MLDFVADVGALDCEQPYSVEVLARLQELIPCEAAAYQEVDLRAGRFLRLVDVGPEVDDVDEAIYWSAGPCPITEFRLRHGDLRAVALSELISPRRFRQLELYCEYFRHCGVEHMLDLGLAGPIPRYRSLILFRPPGERDFSGRDRAVLEALRPHLRRLEAHAELRRRVAALEGTQDTRPPGAAAPTGLTPREREIVRLVAEGKTNAEIAAILWVAPSTVKKHLEHVYEKLGVGRRAAAAAAHVASIV